MKETWSDVSSGIDVRYRAPGKNSRWAEHPAHLADVPTNDLSPKDVGTSGYQAAAVVVLPVGDKVFDLESKSCMSS